jgi:hypothetical protein
MSIASLFDTIARYREALIPVGGSVAQAARGLRVIGRVLLGGIVGIRERARRMPKEGIILILIFMAFERPAPAQTQSVETHGAQSPAVIANDVTITYGLSPDQMQELTKAATAGAVGPLADKIVELSQKLGVTRDATVTFLHILGQQEVPLESLGQKLHEVAEKYKSAMDRLAALDPRR